MESSRGKRQSKVKSSELAKTQKYKVKNKDLTLESHKKGSGKDMKSSKVQAPDTTVEVDHKKVLDVRDDEKKMDTSETSSDEDKEQNGIRTGSEFQVCVPEKLYMDDNALYAENEDTLLWDPYRLTEEQIEQYLLQCATLPADDSRVSAGSRVRDNEQALLLLMECDYNMEEALRRWRSRAETEPDTSDIWSEEERERFENGFRLHGKDFRSIQNKHVRTRTIEELVQYYYLWKKTERHDVFVSKVNLEKKKYKIHPGCTDIMDKFLKESHRRRGRIPAPRIDFKPTRVKKLVSDKCH